VQRGASFGLARHITLCWEDPQEEEWALFLEDDVVIARDAFVAFQEAVRIRENSPWEGNIVGVALHDQRVNQFCWSGDVEKMVLSLGSITPSTRFPVQNLRLAGVSSTYAICFVV